MCTLRPPCIYMIDPFLIKGIGGNGGAKREHVRKKARDEGGKEGGGWVFRALASTRVVLPASLISTVVSLTLMLGNLPTLPPNTPCMGAHTGFGEQRAHASVCESVRDESVS